MKLFYSWQSDIKNHINFSFIDEAIRTALTEINKLNPNTVITPDRDTKGEAGAVDIQTTILKKIANSDMCVFDVSIVNSQYKDIKKSINPNVAFELGYAVSQIGWNNIILVFNEHYGDVKTDIPFDLQRHRVLVYNFDGENNKRKNSMKNLTDSLKEAILTIIKNPHSNENIESVEEKKKIHDEKVIKEFLGKFNISEFEKFIKDIKIKEKSSDNILKYYEQISDYVMSSEYFLYDKEFKRLSEQFVKALDLIFEDEFLYFIHFRNGLEKRKLIDSKKFLKELTSSKNTLKEVIAYIKENYIDIEF